MLPAIYDDQREALLRLSAMLVLGSLCVLPMTAPGTGTLRAEGIEAPATLRMPEIPSDLPARSIALRRDPFVPSGASASGAPQANGGDASLPDIVLPPNAGADSLFPDAHGSAVMPLVRALVLGPHSRALIDVAGEVSVYGVGDRLGDAAIAAIDAAGVVLTSGVRLPVVQGAR